MRRATPAGEGWLAGFYARDGSVCVETLILTVKVYLRLDLWG